MKVQLTLSDKTSTQDIDLLNEYGCSKKIYVCHGHVYHEDS
jgi:hypothetical protein